MNLQRWNQTKWGAVGLLLIMLLLLSACTSTKPRMKGFLWKIEDADSTVYLYGSIHVGKERLFPLDESVEAAFERSATLALELNVLDAATGQANLKEYGYYEGDASIFDHLSTEGAERLVAAAKEVSLSPSQVQQLRPAAAAALISSIQMQRHGYSPKYGIDTYFATKAVRAKKPLIELEGIEYQSKLLYHDLTDREQEQAFILPLKSGAEAAQEYDEVFTMLERGDEEGLTTWLMRDLGRTDAYWRMIVERNRHMAAGIEELLQSDEDCFVVVGLGHYLGKDSIISMLTEKGYKVVRQ